LKLQLLLFDIFIIYDIIIIERERKEEIKMGLDINIYRARNRQVFKDEKWYESTAVTGVYYARKFWGLIEYASFLDVKDDCGEFIELSRENIEELINIATHNADYFGGFETVPQLCEILHNFDENEENGYHYYIEFDY
jgi:hypothetical protein